jgi:hypothetical protein
MEADKKSPDKLQLNIVMEGDVCQNGDSIVKNK